MKKKWETIKFELVDHVALITLNRPDALNALNSKMAVDFLEISLLISDTKIISTR